MAGNSLQYTLDHPMQQTHKLTTLLNSVALYVHLSHLFISFPGDCYVVVCIYTLYNLIGCQTAMYSRQVFEHDSLIFKVFFN